MGEGLTYPHICIASLVYTYLRWVNAADPFYCEPPMKVAFMWR